VSPRAQQPHGRRSPPINDRAQLPRRGCRTCSRRIPARPRVDTRTREGAPRSWSPRRTALAHPLVRRERAGVLGRRHAVGDDDLRQAPCWDDVADVRRGSRADYPRLSGESQIDAELVPREGMTPQPRRPSLATAGLGTVAGRRPHTRGAIRRTWANPATSRRSSPGPPHAGSPRSSPSTGNAPTSPPGSSTKISICICCAAASPTRVCP
jgi:hypothetical protein